MYFNTPAFADCGADSSGRLMPNAFKVKKITFLSMALFFLNACSFTTGVFEKSIPLPGHEWASSFRPDIAFTITDTVSAYNIYIVLRHNDAYHYNNLYLRATVKEPGESRPKSGDYELALATNEKGWIGTAMDDIYDARLLIQPKTKFSKAGTYHFIIEQLMREDPLKSMLSIGLRVEKIQ
ncbi:MAG TPA: gliding motility lipoprotein GldH [Puia sp.]|jgi:gliding motility-associated lipoprotein GldH